MPDDYRPTVLIVDDEEPVTIALRNLLLRSDYQVITHTSARAALAVALSLAVDLVIADCLMPEMDGLIFLSRLRAIQPQVVCVLLTSYADNENSIRDINSAGLYQYIKKPWDDGELLAVVRNGLEKRALIRALENKVAELNHANSKLKSIRTALIKAFM